MDTTEMKKYLICVLLALGVGCTIQEDPDPKTEVKETEVIEELEPGREYFTLDPGELEPGWLLAVGYGGDSLLLRYTAQVDTLIYSPYYLHVPDTLQLIVNDLYVFKARVRWDMPDTTWIKEYIIYWADSTYSWYSSISTTGFAYPEEFVEDLKLQIL